MLKTVISWGWSPILIVIVAVVGYIYEWPIVAVAPLLGLILVVGLVALVITTREKEFERLSLRFRQLAGYFNHRFTGNSALSIFTIIDGVFNIDNPKLWDWARACDMSQRIFDTWCNSFISRMELDIRIKRFDVYLQGYLNELWLVNDHYYEFVKQFCEVAEKAEVPPETIDQYNRFAMEYNAFVQDFRDNISEMKKVNETGLEPPSVKLARELPGEG